MSDNGPQFASAEFRKFTKEYKFRHVTSSPHYPQSNGQVERMVQTIKHLLKKAKDPYLAILDYRNTLLEELGLSPAQLFLARRLKTKLPVSSTLLKPQNAEFVRESLMTRQAKQKRKFDRHVPASDLKPLVQGENVMIKHNEKWMHGSVVEKHETPRSYIVETSNGKKYRRNRRDLKSTKSVHEDVTIEEDFDLKPYRGECTVQPKNPDKGKGTQTLKPGSPHRGKAKEEDLQPRKSIPTGPSTVESASRCEVMPNSVKTKSGREVKKPLRFRDE
ncbi:uncharacterized protein K02A2.6-like [Ostrea edulis]|uniref:uncharacterized protein K02A2.6-like n=1 Tax=Ostrea edulis TaxID=37623 RepID=UPI0024AF0EAB|nr:uncharacterized protein K02A2.6-like [Ostrea edulis]